MGRKAIFAGVGVAVLVLAMAVGSYAYFFSGLRSAPKPLSQATSASTPQAGGKSGTPVASGSPAAAGSPAASSLAGKWTVASGSVVGYRVKEQFANQTSQHEAVARTSDVSGSVTVAAGGGALQAAGLNFSAKVGSLTSVDTVAGFNVSQRDRLVIQSLAVQQFPNASFVADSVAVPSGLEASGSGNATAGGQLTIHGVTRPAQVPVQCQLSGGRLTVTGSTQFDMTDFGVQPPQVPITTVQHQVTIEFQLVLTKS